MISTLILVAFLGQAPTTATIARPGGAGNWHLVADQATLAKIQTATLGDFTRMREAGAVQIVPNGAKATILEDNDNATRVRLEDGREGWVESVYVKGSRPVENARTVEKEAEVYKAYKSALAAAKGRAASKPLSVRKRAMEAAPEVAKKTVADKYMLDRTKLENIIKQGEAADGTAAKEAEKRAKVAAKARAAEDMAKTMAPPSNVGHGIPPGVSARDYQTILRATGAIPPR